MLRQPPPSYTAASKERGLDAFCAGDWQLPPEAKALRDEQQTYTWTPTEDWDDCEQHARNIIGDGPAWKAFEAELEAIQKGEIPTSESDAAIPEEPRIDRQGSLPGFD